MGELLQLRPTLESQLRASVELGPERLRRLAQQREEQRRVAYAARHCAVCGKTVPSRTAVVVDRWLGRVMHARCAREAGR
jgi:hypothetical protein